MNYTPRDWYWIVNGDETRWFSSKSGSWVPPVEGGFATRIASAAELVDVLNSFGISPGTLDLAGYAAAVRYAKETGGVVVNGMRIATDRASQSMINGAYAYAQANPGSTVQFKSENGFVTLDAPTMAAIAQAVGAHVQACFAKEAEVAASIGAGTITSTAQVDAAFSSLDGK